MSKYLKTILFRKSFKVIVLKGSGDADKLIDDAESVASALHDLGYA